MCGHAVINDHLMLLPIAEKFGDVCSIVVGLLILDQPGQKMGLGIPPAEEIENRSEIGKLYL